MSKDLHHATDESLHTFGDAEYQAYIDALPDDHSETKMFNQIDLWARQTYRRHKAQVRGQMFEAGDSERTHIIYAAFRWAKEHGNPLGSTVDKIEPETATLHRIISECYQAIGVLAADCERFDDPIVQKALDNAGSFALIHQDVLPFPSKHSAPDGGRIAPEKVAELTDLQEKAQELHIQVLTEANKHMQTAVQALLKASKEVLGCTEFEHRPPVRDALEIGRMAGVRLHALADLHDAVNACEKDILRGGSSIPKGSTREGP